MNSPAGEPGAESNYLVCLKQAVNMALGVLDLENERKSLVVAVPRQLYQKLKTFGGQRKIIADALVIYRLPASRLYLPRD